MSNNITLNDLRKRDKISEAITEWGKFLVLSNDFIGQKMIKEGHFENRFVKVLVPYIKSGDIVIDVGANIGCYTIPFGKCVGEKGKVFAFEPQSVICSLLHTNCQENLKNTNIIIREEAVGHQIGQANMGTCYDKIDYFTNRITNFGGLELGKYGDPVKMITLDSLLDSDLADDTVKLIKIDVEGAERIVFWGAKKLITRDRPLIFWEKNFKTITKEMMQMDGMTNEIANFNIVNFLKELGYTFSSYGDNILGIPTATLE